MTTLKRDYSFLEWQELSASDKREIINHYWTPFHPEIGSKTRSEIIDEFKRTVGQKLDYCTYRYLGFYATAIFVIPSDNSTRIPTEFAGIPVNKGKVEEKISDSLWKVKWRLSGKEEVEI